MLPRKLVVAIILFCFSQAGSLLYGQELPFRHYSIADGLISNNVTDFCQDSLGFIWIATTDGISRYDSQEFVNYTIADGLSSNNIACIIADKYHPGVVWIGTDRKGVDRFSDGRFTNYAVGSTEQQKSVNALFQDITGNIWCGTEDGIFLIENDASGRKVERFHWLENKEVVSISASTSGEIFFGTSSGVYFTRVIDRSPVLFSCPVIARKKINGLFVDSSNNLWVSTFEGSIVLCKECDPEQYFFTRRINAPSEFSEDARHRIWMSTGNGLLVTTVDEFKHNIFTGYTQNNGLQLESLSSVMVDREDVVWAGSLQNGFVNLPSTDLIEFAFPQKNNMLWSSTACDSFGHFWVTNGQSLIELFKTGDDTWESFNHALQRTTGPISLIRLLYIRSNNELLCVYSNGIIETRRIVHHNGKKSGCNFSREINLRKFMKFTSPFTICLDQSGNLWCSLLDRGVVVLNSDLSRVIKLYTARDVLPDNSIRSIFQDSHGAMWIGGYDGGLVKLPNALVQEDIGGSTARSHSVPLFYSTKNGLPNNGVRAIAETDGKVIVGTRYGGLAVFSQMNSSGENDSIVKIFHSKAGLISDGIWDIQSLPDRRIWLCTQAGVQEVIFGKQIHFRTLDRVPKVPFYSSALSKDGYLCVASGNAVFIYNIKDETKMRIPMPVYVTRTLVNGEEMNLEKKNTLPSSTYSVSFEFVGVTNKLPDKTYQCRLLDVEKKFRTLYDENSITYAGLGHGKYTFEVYGVNGDMRGATPASISFIIETPFYAQWYFIVMMITVIIAIAFFLLRQRLQRLSDVRKVRQRIAMDLHDEIGSGLTKIAMLSEYALQENRGESGTAPQHLTGNELPVTEPSRDRIGKIARSLIDSIADVVWSIDPKYDTLADFVFSFRTYANELTEAKGIHLDISTGKLEGVKIGPQIKRTLQLVSKEALNNAVKYSGCKNITYRLYVHNGKVFLSFEDDGCGYDRSSVELGNGINNMEKNAKELDGIITMTSALNHGTKILLQFPLRA